MSKYIIESVQEKYRKSELRIGELEREKKWLIGRVDYLLGSVQALGEKLGYTPMQAREEIDQFYIRKELEMNEKAKEEFKKKIAAGEAPDFKVIDNMDGKAEIPGTEGAQPNG